MSEEDALAALKLARKHADAGNHVAALKWARKSLAINATPDARFLVEKLESGAGAAAAGPSGSSTSSATAPGGEGLRSRAPAAAAAGSSPAPSARAPPEKQKAREWTPEQAAVVKRVNAAGRAHDYYGVLGLKKEDSPDESAVKKGYRKLALQLHPDKNGAPGADEAFKIVSKAFTILSDGDKRAIYDRQGGDPDARQSMGAGPAFRGGQPFRTYGGGMNGEIDPQDLFNMFFGGGMGPGFGGGGTTFHFGGPGGARVYTAGGGQRRAGAGGARGQQAADSSPLLQLLPLLILGLFSLISYLPSLLATPDPSFTWAPSGVHTAQRFTPRHGVSYHVSPVQWEKHPFVEQAKAGSHGALKSFEDRVENGYKNVLYASCERSREHQQRRILNTRGFLGIGGQPELEKKIRAERYEACERLEDFGIYFNIRV